MSEPGRKHEVSAGVVVFRGDEVLVIKNRFGEWVLPKGKVEPGETPEEAAVREVEEETKVRADILKPVGTSTYTYLSEHTGEPVDKVVHWFLGRVAAELEQEKPGESAGSASGPGPRPGPAPGPGLGPGSRPAPQREEGITAARFIPWRDAVELLEYDGDLVRRAAAEGGP
ncbi:MAG: NUDIX domain-containing protein [Bacillota bacterium]